MPSRKSWLAALATKFLEELERSAQGDDRLSGVSDFPEHASGLTCHREQFFAVNDPRRLFLLELSCFTTVPKDTSRWLFPSLGRR